jgi:hypothetical protein
VGSHQTWLAFGQRYLVHGYGEREMAAGAAAFLDRERVQGPMFDMYDIGGDLLYRNRKVFVDGRNVDYGFDFLKRVFDAATDRLTWTGLDNQYGFTHAVLWYAPFVDRTPLPYVAHLEQNPAWALVYLDDWTAVYLKNTAENRPIVDRHRYVHVRPADLYTYDVLQRTRRAELASLVDELNRLVAEAPASIQARLLLSQIYIQVYRDADAVQLLQDAMKTEPHAHRPHLVLSALYARQEHWADAAREFERAVDLAGPSGASFDYAYLADLFMKAGDPAKAGAYRQRAGAGTGKG